MKKASLTILFVLILTPSISAADYFALGAQIGYRHDEGTSNLRSDSVTETNKNLIGGLLLKADIWSFCFFKAGINKTRTLTEGRSENNSYGIPESWELNYYSFNFYAAAAFPFEDLGSIYMGPGVTIMKTDGRIKTDTTQNFSGRIHAYGFILGAQINISEPLSLYTELEHLRAGQVSTGDYRIDLSGPRINFGFLYYFIRDRL